MTIEIRLKSHASCAFRSMAFRLVETRPQTELVERDVCFHFQTFCGLLAPAAGFPRDIFSRGSHWVVHVRTCACVSLSWYRHTQLAFSGGLAPLTAQRVDGTGTEQQGGPPLGRAMAWP